MGAAKRVVITDRAPQVLNPLEENIGRNFATSADTQNSQLSAMSLDWSAAAARELPLKLGVPYIDVVVCCDCILERLFGATEPLVEFLETLAVAYNGLRVLMATEMRDEYSVQHFLDYAGRGFDVELIECIGRVQLHELRPLQQDMCS